MIVFFLKFSIVQVQDQSATFIMSDTDNSALAADIEEADLVIRAENWEASVPDNLGTFFSHLDVELVLTAL